MKETIGQQLRQAREARSLTLEQVAQNTHMRVHYLRAMEAGNFEALSSSAQARGFLRMYADYLHLDAAPLLADLDDEAQSIDSEPKTAPRPRSEAPASGVNGRSYEKADEIFVEIGQSLQHQRELLGLSLDDVIRHTHLRRHYLEALETGDQEGLPSPVQGRGMLSNYATFLGLDPEPLLLRFAEGLQARLAVRQADTLKAQPAPARQRRPLPAPIRRLLSSDVLIGGSLTVFLIAFVVWGAIRIFAMRSGSAPSPTSRSIADVLLATPTTTPTLTPQAATPTGLPLPPAVAAGQTQSTSTVSSSEIAGTPGTLGTPGTPGTPGAKSGVQVYITVLERAWMQVKVDDKVEFEGRVLPGNAYSFAGNNRVEILTGNGAALQVFFNQQDQGPMGLFGQVVNRVYTVEGVQTPTPTITPSVTPTARTSPTPLQTPTPPQGNLPEATVPVFP
jgi:cytoskeleton protein RodZ